MEVVWLKDAPLTQYLAELGEEYERPQRPIASAKAAIVPPTTSSCVSWSQLWCAMDECIKKRMLRVVRQHLQSMEDEVIQTLVLYHDDNDTPQKESSDRMWIRHMLPSSSVSSSSCALVMIAVIMMQPWLLSYLLVAAFIVLLTFELVYQWRLWVAVRHAERLVMSVSCVLMQQSAFEQCFRECLAIIKKVEITARGYRISRHLPPISRMEQADHKRRTVRLQRMRLVLRLVNEFLGQTTPSSTPSAPDFHQMALQTIKTQSSAQPTPSLLISALSQQHLRSIIMQSHHVRHQLEQVLEKPLTTERLRDTTRCLEQMHRNLQHCQSQLTRLLNEYNATRQTKATTIRSDQSSDKPSDQQLCLMELQTACETLKALAFGSQHATEDGEGQLDQMDRAWSDLCQAWNHYQQQRSGVPGPPAPVVEMEHDHDQAEPSSTNTATEAEEAKEIEDEDDSLCTYVFTATTDGEPDFDLARMICTSQDQEKDAAYSRTSFLSELQNVLYERQAQSKTKTKTITRQLDQDIIRQKPPPPPPPSPQHNVSARLQSDLLAALQRFPRHENAQDS